MQRSNYTEDEVRALIEHYEHLRALTDTKAHGLKWLARRNDLDAALELIPEEYWEVILVHGLIGFSTYETARLLQISQTTVSKRFRYGIEEAVYLMNGV
ncbi:MAG TPA: hypothetical protein VJ741_05725 [Solirubrobacteraceae bacterium]|nr:hypothetical protein [Solirubrobacteraceae bacterium]